MTLAKLSPSFKTFTTINKIFLKNYSISSCGQKLNPQISSLNSLFTKISLQPHKETIEYKCPSIKSFKLPLIDIEIGDNLIRKEVKLPELSNKKELIDPIFQIDKLLPEIESRRDLSYSCGQPLMNTLKYRRRRMNKKHKKKYLKKMKFVFMKREQTKQKRFEKLKEMYSAIFEKKLSIYDPMKKINRDLEKAKFFGYRVNSTYAQYRQLIDKSFKNFDSRLTRRFTPVDIDEVDLSLAREFDMPTLETKQTAIIKDQDIQPLKSELLLNFNKNK